MVVQAPVDVAVPSPTNRPVIAMTADQLAAEPRDCAVCVVDDDLGVRDSLTALLQTYGFSVLAFGSAAEFLAEEPRLRPGFLIVDQHMPGMDGLATLAAVQSRRSTVPAILVTGRIDPGIAELAAKSGVIAILEKPFATKRLVELIRSGLERPS
jgi:two-component system response regulator FixJ